MKFFNSLLCIALLAASFLSAEASTVSGRVLSAAKNRPLAGVAVSDGFTLVQTASDGSYALELNPRARFVTVYTPDGWRPEGKSFYRDVRSEVEAGQNLEEVDFHLAKYKATGNFIHISDIEERDCLEWIGALAEYTASHKPDFLISSGDICYEPGLKLMSKNITPERMGTRVVWSSGNHDLIKGYKDYLGNPYGEKLYEDCFGPSWYAFISAGVCYMVCPMLIGDATPSYNTADIKCWIEATLATLPEGMEATIICHEIFDELIPEGSAVKRYIYGHRHLNFHHKKGDVEYYCTMAPNKAGIDHSVSAIREFHHTGGSALASALHYAPLSNHISAHSFRRGDKIHVSAAIYDLSADVTGAYVKDGKRRTPLKRSSDFMWEGLLPSLGRDAVVVAQFADGDIVSKPFCDDSALCCDIGRLDGNICLSDLVTDGNLLFVGLTDDGNSQNCGVAAFDPSTLETRWIYRTDRSVRGDVAIADGVIYAGDVCGSLYALEASTGHLLWRRDTDIGHSPSFTEGVKVWKNLVFMGSAKHLTAYDRTTGEVVWRNNSWKGGTNNVCTNGVSDDGALLANGYWVGRYALDALTGELLWSSKEYDNRYSSCSPLAVGNNFIYTGYGKVFEVEARTGKIIGQAETSHIFNTKAKPLLLGDMIIVCTSDNGIEAYDRRDWKMKWSYRPEPALIYSSPYTKNREKTVDASPIAYGENVIAACNDGYIYCFNGQKGTLLWRIEVGLPILSTPLLIGDDLIVADFGGNLYKFHVGEYHAREAKEICYSSFNIRIDVEADGANNWSHRRDTVAAFICGQKLDVVAMQEVSDRQLAELQEDLTGYGSVGSVNAIFFDKSKFRLVEKGEYSLSENPDGGSAKGWDSAFPRFVTWARLERISDGSRFVAINTHLDHVGVIAQKEGATLLMARMASISGGEPVVLTGDFNSGEGDVPYGIITCSSFKMYDSHKRAERISGVPYSYHEFGSLPIEKRQKIDFLFVSEGVETISCTIPKEGSSHISDHCPLIVRLRL